MAALVVGVAPTAHAELQGRDLDAATAGFEAYYDTTLNITWLADANYAQTSGYDDDGLMDWDAAKAWAAQLNINGTTGWRMPDVKPVNGISFQYYFLPNGSSDYGYNITSTQSELVHLYHVTLGNKSQYDTSGNYQPDFDLKNTGPFSNFQSLYYWSGVEDARGSYDGAWYFYTYGGLQNVYPKYLEFSAWAVRPGDVAAATVPEPSTYALALAGLAALLVVRRRRHA